MEFVVAYLPAKERGLVAQTCSFLHSVNKEVPYAVLRATPESLHMLHRAYKVIISMDIPIFVSPMCRDLTIYAPPDATGVHTLVCPRLEHLRYHGSWHSFSSLVQGLRNMKTLEVHCEETRSPMMLTLGLRELKTSNFGPLRNTSADRYILEGTDYARFGHSIRHTASIQVTDARIGPVYHPNVDLVQCTLDNYSPDPETTTLALRCCNLVCSDIPYLPKVTSIDFSDNDTLKVFPRLPKVNSLNLLHTGIRKQPWVCLQQVVFPADFVGLTITKEDLEGLRCLMQKDISVLEVCCDQDYDLVQSPSIKTLILHTTKYWKPRWTDRRHCSYFSRKGY